MQPHGRGAGAAVVEERNGTRAQIFHVAARVRRGVQQSGGLAFFVFEQRRAGGGFVRNRLPADLDGVIGHGRFFLGRGGVTFFRRLRFRRLPFPFRRLRRHADLTVLFAREHGHSRRRLQRRRIRTPAACEEAEGRDVLRRDGRVLDLGLDDHDRRLGLFARPDAALLCRVELRFELRDLVHGALQRNRALTELRDRGLQRGVLSNEGARCRHAR